MTALCLGTEVKGCDWRGFRALFAALARVPWGNEEEEAEGQAPGTAIDPLRRRDPEAWRRLFATEMPAVYRYALSRLGNAADAEDLASNVFAEAWEHAGSLEDRGLPPRAWLFGIARNLVSTHRRRWFKRQPILALEAFDGQADDPGLSADLLDLARGVAALAASHAEVITLRFIHGLSLQETAEVLQTTVDGVKGRQARALAELRAQLGEAPSGGGG